MEGAAGIAGSNIWLAEIKNPFLTALQPGCSFSGEAFGDQSPPMKCFCPMAHRRRPKRRAGPVLRRVAKLVIGV
jgi:hypothetical protein